MKHWYHHHEYFQSLLNFCVPDSDERRLQLVLDPFQSSLLPQKLRVYNRLGSRLVLGSFRCCLFIRRLKKRSEWWSSTSGAHLIQSERFLKLARQRERENKISNLGLELTIYMFCWVKKKNFLTFLSALLADWDGRSDVVAVVKPTGGCFGFRTSPFLKSYVWNIFTCPEKTSKKLMLNVILIMGCKVLSIPENLINLIL